MCVYVYVCGHSDSVEEHLVTVDRLDLDMDKYFKGEKNEKKKKIWTERLCVKLARVKNFMECILGSLIRNIQSDDFQPPRSTKSFCEVIEKYVYLYILPFGKVEEQLNRIAAHISYNISFLK